MDNPKVLFLDDDTTVSFLGKQVLSQARFSVFVVPTIAKFWETVETMTPDLILLDIELPDGSGIELCQKLRQMDAFGHTPILTITGHDDPESVVDALAGGTTDFMSKPLNWNLFLQRVRLMWHAHLVLLDAQKNQNLLARAQNIAKIGNWEKDLHSGMITASEQFVKMISCGDSLTGDLLEVFLSAVIAEDRELVKNALDELLATQKSQTVEHRIISEIDFIYCRHLLELRFNPITGEPVSIFGTLQDISEEKRRELLAVDRNQILELIIENKVADKELYKACYVLMEHQFPGCQMIYAVKKGTDDWCLGSASANFSEQDTMAIITYLQKKQIRFTPEEIPDGFLLVPSFIVEGIENRDKLLLMLPFRNVENASSHVMLISAERSQYLFNEEYKLKSFVATVLEMIGVIINNINLFRRLNYQAYHDVLTGLPNREFFFEAIQKAISENKKSWALMLIDIDRFKNINDTLGNTAGDYILCELASHLQEIIFPGDVLSRISSDEFILLTEESSEEDIQRRAEQIIAKCCQLFKVQNYQVNLSVSCGIACYPKDGSDSLQLQKNADAALYFLKKRGGGSYMYYDDSTMRIFTQQQEIENEMKLGLERGEFYLQYQPKVGTKDGKISGYEALLRWNRPGSEFISPAVFVPVAEESGFIVSLGTWVLEEACRSVLELHKKGFSDIHISVNVSTVQFVQENFVKIVKDILEKTGFPPKKLELEVTESAVMHDIDIVVARLKELRGLGLSIAVDDFGTGYSSMAYLRLLPIDCLKIDRSFIMELFNGSDEERKKSQALVESVLGLAENLELEVVAEGVEIQEELEFLQQRKCQLIQGYYTGKPGDLIEGYYTGKP